MRVLVTGATGFVGSHTALALSKAGHEVRVLVRNPERLQILANRATEPEVILGDMTDARAVGDAMDGCDAVIHAAAQVGVGGGEPASDANIEGVRTVIGAALRADVGRIVYTSSVTVHMPTEAPAITLESPLVEPLSPYAASKVASERLIREWQDAGLPITTVVLGGVYGPYAPDLVNSFTAIISALELMMLVPPGGTLVIDVRDVADLLTRVIEHENFVPRVLAGGHFISWGTWVAALERAVGHPVAYRPVTRNELEELARALVEAAAGTSNTPALTEEAAVVMGSGVPADDQRSLDEFSLKLRPLDETFADVIAYLRTVGRIPSEVLP